MPNTTWNAVRLGLATAALGGCLADPKTGNPRATPEVIGKSVVGYVENARGLPDEVAYGWDLRVAAGVARWRECPAPPGESSDRLPETCTEVERERPAAELLAFAAAGHAPVGDAGDVEVLRLTLKTRRRNIMPRAP